MIRCRKMFLEVKIEKEIYIQKANKYFKLKKTTRNTFINQINKFYELNNTFKLEPHKYKIGDEVILKQGTFLHGSRNAMEMIEEIKNDGIISIAI